MATPTRKYAIRNSSGQLVGLVEATNAPQALRHFARDQFSVDAATCDDGLAAAASGIQVQRAAEQVAE